MLLLFSIRVAELLPVEERALIRLDVSVSCERLSICQFVCVSCFPFWFWG